MSDMPTHKVKIKADTVDEASKAARDKCRKDGCDVRGALMPQLLSEGEWEVEVIIAEDKPKKKSKLKIVKESDKE